MITGITGFIGMHVVKAFLDDGTYKVRGTCRSKANPEKMEPLKKAFGEKFEELEIFEADLTNKESLEKAAEGCTYIVHVASPFQFSYKTDDDCLKPAIEGTENAVNAAIKHNVKRIVITSSAYSCFLTADKEKTEFSEKDWSDDNLEDVYARSKVLAE